MTQDSIQTNSTTSDNSTGQATQTSQLQQTSVQGTQTTQTSSDTHWTSKLDESIRSDVTLQKFTDENALAKSYIEAQKLLGTKLTKIPTKDSSPEIWREFRDKVSSVDNFIELPSDGNQEALNKVYSKLGRPEKSADYKFEVPAELSENVKIDETLAKNYAELAHGLGLSQKQASALYDFQLNSQIKQAEAMDQFIDSEVTSLKNDWGSDYESRLALANGALKLWAEKNPSIKSLIQSSAIRNNSALTKLFYELGKNVGEGNIIKKVAAAEFKYSKTEASEKIAEIRSNPEHPYHKKDHLGHVKAQEEMRRLYEIIGN